MTHPPSHQTIKAVADRLILEQGRLDPLELLLAADLLPYAAYESWRMGHSPRLDDALALPGTALRELLAGVGDYAQRQGLTLTPEEPRGWGARDTPLQVSTNSALHLACTHCYTRPSGRVQLDLFQDSGALLLEEELHRALAERRGDQAREGLARLTQREPNHPHIPDYLTLIAAINATADGSDPGPNRRQTAERLAELDALEPLAKRLMGHRARDILSPLWADLAQRLAGQRFDPRRQRLHAGHAWARAERWEQVREAVERETDWSAHSALVLTHADAAWRAGDQGTAREDWLRLCWDHPETAEETFDAGTLPDTQLQARWNRFCDLDDDLPVEDFPPWLLIQEPGYSAACSPEIAPDDERGDPYRLVHQLIGEGDRIDLRRALAAIHAPLLQAYLERRAGR